MSEEEKKAVENLKTEYEKLIKEDNILFPLYKSDAKRLINLIEKQSKEIEELKRYEEGYKLLSYSLDNYTKNDKIKAKIEELDKAYEDSKNEDGESEYYYPNYTVEVLQSLLEKE